MMCKLSLYYAYLSSMVVHAAVHKNGKKGTELQFNIAPCYLSHWVTFTLSCRCHALRDTLRDVIKI